MTSVAFVGEAWGKDEQLLEEPFVGASGQELFRMLKDAGFHSTELPYHFVSPSRMSRLWESVSYERLNVFNARPPDPTGGNNAEAFYASLADECPVNRVLPRRRFGSSNKYVKQDYASHVYKLRDDLSASQPNLIIALGATALWALGLPATIGKLRGSVIESEWGKVLPIYDPERVIRNWGLRVVSILDLIKARREMEFPELRIKPRYIWTKPTIADLYAWWEQYGKQSALIAFDIETICKTQISEIGFASDSSHALHIPFVIEHRDGNKRRYQQWWPDVETEVEAWKFVRMVCESDNPKIGQNFIQYDAYWMLKELGIGLHKIQDDTMTKAHCWQPELDKNLGFLGSIFLDERSWKSIRTDVGKDND